jgi:hypothetical protein
MIYDSANFIIFAVAILLLALMVFRYRQHLGSLPKPGVKNPIGF